MIGVSIQIPNYYVNRGVSRTYPLTDAFVAATALTDLTAIAGLRGIEDGIRDNGWDSKILCLYPYVADAATNADRLTQMSRNFMNPSLYQIAWTGSPTAAAVTSANSGVTGNTTTMFGNTGFNPNTVYGVSPIAGMHVYLGDTAAGIQFSCDIGVADLTIQNTIQTRGTDASALNGNIRIGQVATGASASYTYPAGGRMYSAVRTGATSLLAYQNGVLVSTDTTNVFVNHSNRNLFVMVLNLNGSPLATTYSPRQQRTALMTDGTIDPAVLFTVLQNYNTTLNRA